MGLKTYVQKHLHFIIKTLKKVWKNGMLPSKSFQLWSYPSRQSWYNCKQIVTWENDDKRTKNSKQIIIIIKIWLSSLGIKPLIQYTNLNYIAGNDNLTVMWSNSPCSRKDWSENLLRHLKKKLTLNSTTVTKLYPFSYY